MKILLISRKRNLQYYTATPLLSNLSNKLWFEPPSPRLRCRYNAFSFYELLLLIQFTYIHLFTNGMTTLFSMNCQMELKNFAGLMVRVGNLTHRIRHELILWSSLTSEAKELLVIVEEFKLKDSVPNS